MKNEIFLDCKVSEGMFSHEAVVELPRKTGQSCFVVHKSAVTDVDQSGRGKVRATLVKWNDGQWAILPTDYRDAIPYDEAELGAA